MNDFTNTSPMFNTILSKLSGDMRFVGIFYIIIGALYCLTIIGAIIGIPFIICGLRLRESADSFSSYMVGGDATSLERALDRQASFFFIQKVLMIIGLVLMVIYVIMLIAFGAAMFSAFSNMPTEY